MKRKIQLVILILFTLLHLSGCDQDFKEDMTNNFYATESENLTTSEESIDPENSVIVQDEVFLLLKEGKYLPVDTNIVDFEYLFAEKCFAVRFLWCEIDGDIHVYKDDTEENAWTWSVGPIEGNSNIVKISLCQEPFNLSYAIFYDLHTDTVLDLLQEVPEEQKKAINYIKTSPGLSAVLIDCFKSEEVYFFDISHACLTELTVLTGISGADSAYFLSEDLLAVIDFEGKDNRDFSVEVHTFNLQTKEATQVVERVPLYSSDYQPEGIVLTGQRYARMYTKTGSYKVDLLTGEEISDSEVYFTEEKSFEIPEGAVSLTEEEINWFNTEFFNDPERGYIENQFLSSFYNEPSEINLHELFYNGIDNSTIIGQEEKNNIIKQIPDAQSLEIKKVTEANITEILFYYMNISLENTQRIGLDKLLYLSDFESYYLVHSDTNLMICEVEEGYRTEDGEVVLLYSNDVLAYEPWQGVVTLRTTFSSDCSNYLFYSNKVIKVLNN